MEQELQDLRKDIDSLIDRCERIGLYSTVSYLESMIEISDMMIEEYEELYTDQEEEV